MVGFDFFGGGVEILNACPMLEKTKRATIDSEARDDDLLVKLVPGNM